MHAGAIRRQGWGLPGRGLGATWTGAGGYFVGGRGLLAKKNTKRWEAIIRDRKKSEEVLAKYRLR